MRCGLLDLDALRESLSNRPPDAAFTAAEAAIYTGRSTRTLKRAIDAGVGPRREKNPDVTGLGANNRHTRYRKADLDEWRDSLVAFARDFRDFEDLAADAPWVVEGEKIAGHLLNLPDLDAVLVALGSDAVIFLRIDEALRRAWVSAEERHSYLDSFAVICAATIQTAADVAQRDEMEMQTGPARGESRGPLRP